MNNHILTNIGDLIDRLHKRADIREQITSRKSVQEGKPDRLNNLLREAATAIDNLAEYIIEVETKAAIRISQLESDRSALLSGKRIHRAFDEVTMQRACTKVLTERTYEIND